MPYVIDLTGEEYPLKATITNDGEVNGNQILSATIEFNDVNKAFIRNIAELWRIVDHDDVEHVIKYCRRRGVGDKMAVDIKGVPVFFDKLDNDRIYDRIDKHMTASEAFTRIFEDTGFTFVLVDSFAAVDWEGFGDGETKLESFKRALERYKCEFEISGNTVYLRSQIGRDTSIMYRHKLNASNIVQEIDANELWTFARGYGDYGDGEGNEDWRDAKLIREYTSPLANILGIRHAPPIKNGNIKDPAFMDAQLKTLVDESLKISVSATIHDLRKQGYPYAQSQLGDRVFLIDERIGLNEEVRVVAQSITRDWKGDVVDINITFGSHSIVKRHQSSLQTAIKNITDLIEGRKKLPFNVLDNAVMEATRALTRMQSQLQITENGSLLAVDKTNPNNLVILNAAGLGVSNDGGQTFGQAITGNGIVADYIVTGTLRGIYIEGVEINGSIIRSESDSNTYTQIQNAFVESRGRHTRTWKGKTETHDVSLRMANGYFRARNHNRGWSLYFSDWGVSTYADGTGNDDASGYIEFHSPQYSPSGSESGITIGSLGGRAALETDGARIYLNPNGADVWVADMQDRFYSIRTDWVYASAIRQHPDDYSGTGTHLYLGVSAAKGAEVRVTDLVMARGDPINYRPIRAYTFYSEGNGIIVNGAGRFHNSGDGISYVQGNSEIRATRFMSSDYVPVRAASFPTGSLAEYKTNIQKWEGSALEQIRKTTIYEYNLKAEVEQGVYRRRQGLIIGEGFDTPDGVIDGDGVEQYLMNAWSWKAIQELDDEVTSLKNEISSLTNAIQELKRKDDLGGE